jgi:hypothetical protein
VRRETVDAREINELDLEPTSELRSPDPPFDRHAGVVGCLLAQAGEAIEESRFAGVRRPHESHESGMRAIDEPGQNG